MNINIVSLFPEFFYSALNCGLMSKAKEAKKVNFYFYNPRDNTLNKRGTVDDRPYGGGPGMVMTLKPIVETLEQIPKLGRILLMTPRGKVFNQTLAQDLSQEENITIICGRYEGIDARLEQLFLIEPVSVGDYVLNGGESAALIMVESVSRLVSGFMGHEESGEEESFSHGLLEYPHYTRPEEFRQILVPEVLLQGNHAVINSWRRQEALLATLKLRPELMSDADLTEDDIEFIKDQKRLNLGRNLYLALVHYPVLGKDKKSIAVSLTNLDIHDIARCSCTYRLGGSFIVTPIEDQLDLLENILKHWIKGSGARANPDRAFALKYIFGVKNLEEAKSKILEEVGQAPLVVGTSARGSGGIAFPKMRHFLQQGPVLLLLGTSHGLSPELLNECQSILRPLRCFDAYNHLSVRTATAIMVDRILGDFG